MLEILNVNFNIVSFKSFEDYSVRISTISEKFSYDKFSKNNNFSDLEQGEKNAIRHNLLLHCYIGTIEKEKMNGDFTIKQEAKSYFECVKSQGVEKAR